jgi:hypothetical protein
MGFKAFDFETVVYSDEGHPVRITPGYYNCIFEIDSSDYFECSTRVRPGQMSDLKNDNLFSCYALFEWVGYQLVQYREPKKEDHEPGEEGEENDDHIPLIRLQVRNPESVKSEEGYTRPAMRWIEKKGVNHISRTWTPRGLHTHFADLRSSFRRNTGGQPYPKKLMGQISDADFLKMGFLDELRHPCAENLWEFPDQPISCFFPEMSEDFGLTEGEQGKDKEIRSRERRGIGDLKIYRHRVSTGESGRRAGRNGDRKDEEWEGREETRGEERREDRE